MQKENLILITVMYFFLFLFSLPWSVINLILLIYYFYSDAKKTISGYAKLKISLLLLWCKKILFSLP